MARSVNKVILLGRLGRDPEVRYSQDGSAIANFSLATDEPVKAADGNWETRPEWHRIVAFQKTAEVCANYLFKGSQVYVEGKLRTRNWEDNTGTKRYTTEIVARDIVLLGGRGDQSSEAQTAQGGYTGGFGSRPQGRAPAPSAAPAPEPLPGPPDGPDEEIPF